MMKWLRAHTKQIMVVVVLLAMFSFVGGSALYNLLAVDRGSIVAMKVFGREVNQAELGNADSATRILERIFVNWRYGGEDDFTVRHWFMLGEEAQRAGIVVADQDIEAYLDQMDEFRKIRQLPPLSSLRRSAGTTRPMLRDALRRHMRILKHAGRVTDAAIPSEPQMRHYARDTEDKMRVRFVPLDAAKFVDREEVLTETELQRYFDQYNDVDAGTGSTGIGYKYADRVRIQYAIASVDTLRSEVQVTQEDVKNHWKANKDKYKKTVQVDAPTPAAAPTTTRPTPRKVSKQVVQAFSEARETVERELRDRKALKIARRAMGKLADEMAKPWTELSTDPETGFKPIPNGADQADLLKAASARIAQRFGITIDYAELPISSEAELGEMVALKNTSTPSGEGDEPLSLSAYAFRVEGLYSPKNGRDVALRLQMFQCPTMPLTRRGRDVPQFIGRQLVTRPGPANAYAVFRVVGTSPSQSPATLDEVRSKVEKDVRLAHAFVKLAALAKEFGKVATHVGIEKALTMFEDVRTTGGVLRVSRPSPFPRKTRLADADLLDAVLAGEATLRPTTVIGVGESEAFIDACFEMTAEDWTAPPIDAPPTDRTADVMTQPAVDPAPSIRLIPIERLWKWFIVEHDTSSADGSVNTASYEATLRAKAFRSLAGERRTVLRNRWFNTKQIETRCGFEDVLREPAPDTRGGVKTPAPESDIPRF